MEIHTHTYMKPLLVQSVARRLSQLCDITSGIWSPLVLRERGEGRGEYSSLFIMTADVEDSVTYSTTSGGLRTWVAMTW